MDKEHRDSRRDEMNKMRYITPHERYHMVGADLFILVDDIMFKVHSYFFRRDSRGFFDDFQINASPNVSQVDDQGSSEDRAIRIPNVTVKDFEHLLWVFYNPRYNLYKADISAFFSILRLAHRWDFPNVTDFAMRELGRREIPLVPRIKLYKEYSAPREYLVPLYAKLCARPSMPTKREALELGFDDTCDIFRAREALRFPGGSSPLPSGMSLTDTYSTISEVFGLPIYSYPQAEKTSNEDTTTNTIPAPMVKDTKKKAKKDNK